MINTITENIDIWTTAQTRKSKGRGRSVDNQAQHGIEKLRELILDLAVRGKLIPQDPNDESASVLLNKVAKKKTRLIEEGKIRAQKSSSDITEEEKTIELPDGWLWIRLNEYYDVRDGTHDSPKQTSSGYPLVTSKNLYSGKLDLSNVSYISTKDHLKIIERSKVDLDDILFAMIGSIGNPVIVDTKEEFSIKNVALFKYYSRKLSNPRYLQIFLLLASFELKEKAAGGVQSFVSLGKLRNHLMPLPPLAEQHRIVAKVDELMELCDQLEQEQTENNKVHETLVNTLLNILTSAKDQAEFEEAWKRISQNFDVLFTTEQSIDQLKQTILQLAVMGKLVPQNPDDEPASVLLDKIAKEKAKLVKEGKLKAQEPLPDITEEEQPFDLPESWEWVTWQKILSLDGEAFKRGPFGSSLKKNMFVEKGYKVYEQYCPINDDCSFERYYITKEKFEEMQTFEVMAQDYLISCSGATLGRITQVPIVYKKGIINQALLRVRINHKYIDGEYFKLLFRSPYFQRLLIVNSTGSAIPNLKGVRELKKMPVPLLSINEQQKIIKRLKELFDICDALKQKIIESQETKVHLADAIVKQAVA